MLAVMFLILGWLAIAAGGGYLGLTVPDVLRSAAGLEPMAGAVLTNPGIAVICFGLVLLALGGIIGRLGRIARNTADTADAVEALLATRDER